MENKNDMVRLVVLQCSVRKLYAVSENIVWVEGRGRYVFCHPDSVALIIFSPYEKISKKKYNMLQKFLKGCYPRQTEANSKYDIWSSKFLT